MRMSQERNQLFTKTNGSWIMQSCTNGINFQNCFEYLIINVIMFKATCYEKFKSRIHHEYHKHDTGHWQNEQNKRVGADKFLNYDGTKFWCECFYLIWTLVWKKYFLIRVGFGCAVLNCDRRVGELIWDKKLKGIAQLLENLSFFELLLQIINYNFGKFEMLH